jgi:hypothetical protein
MSVPTTSSGWQIVGGDVVHVYVFRRGSSLGALPIWRRVETRLINARGVRDDDNGPLHFCCFFLFVASPEIVELLGVHLTDVDTSMFMIINLTGQGTTWKQSALYVYMYLPDSGVSFFLNFVVELYARYASTFYRWALIVKTVLG